MAISGDILFTRCRAVLLWQQKARASAVKKEALRMASSHMSKEDSPKLKCRI